MFAHPLFSPDAPELRTLFVQGLRCRARIGVYPSELDRHQTIAVNVAVRVDNPAQPLDDRIDRVLDYGLLRQAVLDLVASRHFGLQETLCDAIAQQCLALPGVQAAYVAVAKLEAFADCQAVGCERLLVRP